MIERMSQTKTLTHKDAQIAEFLKSRLEKITPIQRMLVYGSRARGNFLPDSDLDIFIEVPALTPSLRRKISEAAWEIGLDHDIVISTFAASTQEIQNGPLGANPILYFIELDGIAL